MRTIGIDLGTTNCLAAVWDNGKSVLIPNSYGEYLTPSIVSLDSQGQVYVGKSAKERMVAYPEQSVSVFKRYMGTRTSFELGSRRFFPEELSACLLKKIKEDAESFLKEEVTEAIISVPAYFNDMARNATKRAGELAGFKVERIINEPSAAALACQSLEQKEEALVLVFDFGGGTLDVSLVDCFENIVQIQAVSGDNHLGGSDFDRKIADYFCKEKGLVWDEIDRSMGEVVLKAAETCKRALSEQEEAVMRVCFGENQWELSIDRRQLIRIGAEIFKRIEQPVRRVLSDAGISARELTDIVLVGGSCKMAVVQQYLSYLLEGRAIETKEPDTMIALGLGVCVGIKERSQDIRDMLLTDICPFSLGTGIISHDSSGKDLMSVIIERNTSLPASREHRYVTVRDGQERICMKVYQGENYYAEDNLYLGEVEMRIPPKPAGQVYIDLRYTYDINGILEVQAHVPITGETQRRVIINHENSIGEEEKAKKLKEFEKLKIHPREQEENQFLMMKGEALYVQATGELREFIGWWRMYFGKLLESQNEMEIKKRRKNVEQAFQQAEDILSSGGFRGGLNPYTENWYERNPENTVIEDFEEWVRKNK